MRGLLTLMFLVICTIHLPAKSSAKYLPPLPAFQEDHIPDINAYLEELSESEEDEVLARMKLLERIQQQLAQSGKPAISRRFWNQLAAEKDLSDKRGSSYMTPCHFKICNMGKKRN